MLFRSAYYRYSSDRQSEQSIEGQLRVCQKYAKDHDILILDTYIDRAMTGTIDNRLDFQRMLKDGAKRQWDYVIVLAPAIVKLFKDHFLLVGHAFDQVLVMPCHILH